MNRRYMTALERLHASGRTSLGQKMAAGLIVPGMDRAGQRKPPGFRPRVRKALRNPPRRKRKNTLRKLASLGR